MPVRQGPALYSPAKPITGFLNAVHEGRIEGTVTLQVLREIGTPDSVAPRTLQALAHLGLVTPSGEPTPLLLQFRDAKDPEHRAVFATALREAYAEVLAAVPDLESASEVDLEQAFSIYEPATQRSRMIRLFYGLARYAGMVEGRAPRLTGSPQSSGPRPATPTHKPAADVPAEAHTVELRSGGSVTLSVAVRLFDLSVTDRTFVLELIDRLRGYGAEPDGNAAP